MSERLTVCSRPVRSERNVQQRRRHGGPEKRSDAQGSLVDGPGVRELLLTLAARQLHVVVGGKLLLPRFS